MLFLLLFLLLFLKWKESVKEVINRKIVGIALHPTVIFLYQVIAAPNSVIFCLVSYLVHVVDESINPCCEWIGRRGGLVVSASESGSRGLGSSPGRDHCVVFLGKTLYSHSASLHPGV